MWEFLDQPLVIYPLLAAGLLLLVALATSWLYGDLRALLQGRGVASVSAAVASAFLIYLVSLNPGSGVEAATFGQGLSRLPLYLLALAYGPGVGLLGGIIFVMLSLILVSGHSLGSFEVLVLLELVVLGWLATSPSIFKVRWAAAFNIPFACLLSWATAGTALLQGSGYDARLLSVHWSYHQQSLWAIYICSAVLSLLSPEQCRNLFRGSSLIQGAETIQTQTVGGSSIYTQAVQLEGLETKPVKTKSTPKKPCSTRRVSVLAVSASVSKTIKQRCPGAAAIAARSRSADQTRYVSRPQAHRNPRNRTPHRTPPPRTQPRADSGEGLGLEKVEGRSVVKVLKLP